jgi:transcriptional regulator with GAF, ATPase, and Fis domain
MTFPGGNRTLTGRTFERATIQGLLGRLTCVFPPRLHLSFTLDTRPVTLGRDSEGATGLPVDDPTVSRRHLTIESDASGREHLAIDLRSRNGSSVDGQRLVAPVALTHGAVVRLGDVLLVYERPTPGEPLPWVETPQVSRIAIPGDSSAAYLLRAAVARSAPDPSPALIIGETGTGKELIAAEMHRLSGRRGELVAINCAAISPQLIESQLFGHVRGAFTGAGEANPGLVRAARGGTLFLDEIGELPLELQAKLLRVIQEGEVLPVGGTQATKVDVRIIAATNRDLEADAEAGLFRRDLYARLALWIVRVPPLRERRVDVLGWFDRLHRRWLERRGRSPGAGGTLAFEPNAAEALILNAWPENLRGVDRLVHQHGTMTRPLTVADLPPWLAARPGAPVTSPPPERRVIPAPTREELEAALQETGSVRATAKRYGRDRRQIYRWMEAFGIAGKMG